MEYLQAVNKLQDLQTSKSLQSLIGTTLSIMNLAVVKNWFEEQTLKGPMILRCVKKAISYKCHYVIAVVVPYQIYTVVIMTICANQENNIV